MSNINVEDLIEVLGEEELNKLTILLNSRSTKGSNKPKCEPKPKRKRKRKRKDKSNIQKDKSNTETDSFLHKRVQSKEPPPQRAHSRKQSTEQKRPIKGVSCSIQNIDTKSDRPNLFLTQRQKMAPVTDEERLAIKWDKLVSSKNQPIERTRESGLVEAKCLRCGCIEEVSIVLVRENKGGIFRFTCNDCQVNRR